MIFRFGGGIGCGVTPAFMVCMLTGLLNTALFAQEFVQTTTALSNGFTGGATVYADDGTLFVFSGGDFTTGQGSTSFLAIAPDGTQSVIDFQGAESLLSPGGAAFDSVTGNIVVTDNEQFGDGMGNLFTVNPVTGQTQSLVSGFDAIDDVAVRSTGQIFFSNAAGDGLGSVFQLDAGTAVTVVDGLDFAAGLAFDPDGNLVFQDLSSTTFQGSVFSLQVTETPDGLNFASPELIADNLQAGFDLVADSEGDLFVTGSGGLFQLDRDNNGEFTGRATNVVAAGFSTEVAFLSGDVAFEPDSFLTTGQSSPLLTFVPEFGADNLVTLSVATAIPEPNSGLMIAGIALLVITRRTKCTNATD